MRKILIILLALVALSIVGWFGVYQMKAPDIEADIKQRVGESLASNSLDWVKYDVDGRDVTLSGDAQSKQMAQHALDTADIYGLNSLSSDITVNGESNSGTDDAEAGTDVAAADGAGAENAAEPDAADSGSENAAEPEAAGSGSAQAENTAATTDASAVAAASTLAASASTDSQATPPAADEATDVEVQDVATKGIPALPIAMNISRDESGEYIFNGTVPDMEMKQAVDQHLASVGADPLKAVWQVELSSAEAPENWQPNILNSISAVQQLQEGEVSLAGDQAMIKGTAASQDASDAAEAFAQKIAGDYTTDMNLSISDASQATAAASDAEELPLVGSDKYAAKFCQTEFNALLKQQKIVFESGSSKLQTVSASLLDKVSQVSARCANQGIEVHGYTDSQGAASANTKLSKSRAESVVAYLAQQGVDTERLVAIGHGEKNPVATNKTKAGRAQNRRIKLIVKGLNK